ncbi:MAG: FHA domain-containing protein [Planctomycetota bacterium]
MARVFAICCLPLLLALPAPVQVAEWETLNEEAVSLYKQGDYDRAVVLAKRALEVAERDLAPDHPDVAALRRNISQLHARMDETEEGAGRPPDYALVLLLLAIAACLLIVAFVVGAYLKRPRSAVASSPHFWLELHSSRGALSDVPLVQDVFRIGRFPDNDLVLHHENVASYHARIELHADSAVLVGLNPDYPVYVAGKPVTSHTLAHNDRIRIADTTFLFVARP